MKGKKKQTKVKQRKVKKYKAKQYPLYSISFYKNRNKTICFQETSNIKDGTEPFVNESLNLRSFAIHLAESDILTKGDKLAMCVFFQNYIDFCKKNNYKSSLPTKVTKKK